MDFECVMDKGVTLPVPEIVPFRMTKNMISPLGVMKFDGLFKDSAICVIKIMRKNSLTLRTIFNMFRNFEVRDIKDGENKRVESSIRRLLGLDVALEARGYISAKHRLTVEE